MTVAFAMAMVTAMALVGDGVNVSEHGVWWMLPHEELEDKRHVHMLFSREHLASCPMSRKMLPRINLNRKRAYT